MSVLKRRAWGTEPHQAAARPLVLLVTMGLLASILACGGDSPGQVACRDYRNTVALRWRGELNVFDMNKRVTEIQRRAQSAEPEIRQAATNLLNAVNAFSPERVDAAIDSMRDACVRAGYLRPGPLDLPED